MLTRDQLQYEINEFARLLGLNLDDVSQLIYDTGIEFARRYYQGQMASVAVKQPLYWTWYLTAWHRVDQIIYESTPIFRLDDPWDIYHFDHLPGHLLHGTERKCHPWTEVNRAVNKSFINLHNQVQ